MVCIGRKAYLSLSHLLPHLFKHVFQAFIFFSERTILSTAIATPPTAPIATPPTPPTTTATPPTATATPPTAPFTGIPSTVSGKFLVTFPMIIAHYGVTFSGAGTLPSPLLPSAAAPYARDPNTSTPPSKSQ